MERHAQATSLAKPRCPARRPERAAVSLTYPCNLNVLQINFAPSGCTLSANTVRGSIQSTANQKKSLRRFGSDRRGSVAIMAAMFATLLTLACGLIVQEGTLIRAQQSLQVSANMAALAGASELTTSTATAMTTAITYSAVNKVYGQTPAMVSGTRNKVPEEHRGIVRYGERKRHSGAAASDRAAALWEFVRDFEQGSHGDGHSWRVGRQRVIGRCHHHNRHDGIDERYRQQLFGLGSHPDQLRVGRGPDASHRISTLYRLRRFDGVPREMNTNQGEEDACPGSNPTTVAYNATPDYLIVGLSNDYRNVRQGDHAQSFLEPRQSCRWSSWLQRPCCRWRLRYLLRRCDHCGSGHPHDYWSRGRAEGDRLSERWRCECDFSQCGELEGSEPMPPGDHCRPNCHRGRHLGIYSGLRFADGRYAQ